MAKSMWELANILHYYLQRARAWTSKEYVIVHRRGGGETNCSGAYYYIGKQFAVMYIIYDTHAIREYTSCTRMYKSCFSVCGKS